MLPVRVEISRETISYPIDIGSGHLKSIGGLLKKMKIGTHAVVVTNPIVRKHHGDVLASSLREAGFQIDFLEIPSGEESKSAVFAFDLIGRIVERHAGQDVFIVAFGGGVVGDLAGYVAAAYRRGVPFVQVPTTFLAQIDSAIGGKVGIDLTFGKNLVGAFYHPRVVYSDIKTLFTLDKRQIRNGLAEAVKYGVICDKNVFAFIEANVEDLLGCDAKALTEVVFQCSRIKANIVGRDEREEKGLRTILNFGHTIGHAIEAACDYQEYHHGEAIALGMRIAAEISLQMKLTKEPDVKRLNHVLSRIGLPERIEGPILADILNRMRHDKKFKSGKNRFVLMAGLGSVKVKENIDPQVIQSAIAKFSGSSLENPINLTDSQ